MNKWKSNNVPSDWGSEMSVNGRSKTIMEVLFFC